VTNLLKVGNSRQNFENQKALTPSGDFDVNAGEIVEVTFDASTSGTGSHRISDPQGAIPVENQLANDAFLTWISAPNSLTVTANVTTTGTLKFLVF